MSSTQPTDSKELVAELLADPSFQRKRQRRLKSATGIAYPTGYVVFRFVVMSIARLFMKAEIHHIERIPPPPNGLKWRPRHYHRNRPHGRIGEDPFIVAANHGKVFDIPFLGLLHRNLVWIGKPFFAWWRWLGAMNQRMGAVLVFRPTIDGDLTRKGNSPEKLAHALMVSYLPDEALKKAEDCMLNRGVSVVMFPEGHRHGKSTVDGARYGTARLSRRTNCPILPIAIAGCAQGDHIVKKGLLRRQVIVGIVGELIYPSDFADAGDEPAIEQAIMEAWTRQINQLRQEALGILAARGASRR